MKRLLSPVTNPNGWLTLAAAAYAITQAILNARAHHQPINLAVIASALLACGSALARTQVTPVADPVVPGKLIVPLVAPAPDIHVAGDPSKQPAIIKFEGLQLTDTDIDRLKAMLTGPRVPEPPPSGVQPPATTTGPVTPETSTP